MVKSLKNIKVDDVLSKRDRRVLYLFKITKIKNDTIYYNYIRIDLDEDSTTNRKIVIDSESISTNLPVANMLQYLYETSIGELEYIIVAIFS